MFYFIKGKVESLKKDSIILNVNNIGYEVFVSHVDEFKVGEERRIYIYNVVKDEINYLIGFPTMEEKMIFLSLIKVNGIGPKTVISALRVTTPAEIKKAIECNNIVFLKNLPCIGSKAAYQIVLDLKGKFSEGEGNPKLYEDAKTGLINLGFKKIQVERVLSSINEPDLTTDQIIKLALQKLKK